MDNSKLKSATIMKNIVDCFDELIDDTTHPRFNQMLGQILNGHILRIVREGKNKIENNSTKPLIEAEITDCIKRHFWKIEDCMKSINADLKFLEKNYKDRYTEM